MEETVSHIIERYFPSNPVLCSIISFAVFITITYVREEWGQVKGWLKRHDEEYKDMQETITTGLKEAERFSLDVFTRHNTAISNHDYEIGQLKGKAESMMDPKLIEQLFKEIEKMISMFSTCQADINGKLDSILEEIRDDSESKKN